MYGGCTRGGGITGKTKMLSEQAQASSPPSSSVDDLATTIDSSSLKSEEKLMITSPPSSSLDDLVTTIDIGSLTSEEKLVMTSLDCLAVTTDKKKRKRKKKKSKIGAEQATVCKSITNGLFVASSPPSSSSLKPEEKLGFELHSHSTCSSSQIRYRLTSFNW